MTSVQENARDDQIEEHTHDADAPEPGGLDRDSLAGRRRNTACRTDRGLLMSESDRVVQALRELVDALDRRVAHVDRLGETRIAREAAGLRQEALHRIQELTAATSGRETREAERSDDVMTDDGGPPNTDA